ncbi:alpha/beta fold hydrolase [Kribbella deserti]|uniref:Alpha/beta fold hydrolase n=1 Tax=Kribbella deserti TaxID=1926257 RepID=A0ABV6QP93_9ACTN
MLRYLKVWTAGVVMSLLLLGCGAVPTGEMQTSTAEAERVSFDAATRDDDEFNRQFEHEFADVNGVRMHYVTGGTGEPLVLLHGWPQSWYEWRGLMPELAKRYRVYALDLPGLGDSAGSPTSFDKATLARYVHGLLVDRLGLKAIRLVAHDLGAGVGFQYAAQYPEHVVRYAHLDYPLPGPALSAAKYRTFSWHMAFHTQPKVPELLVDDEVRDYLAAFYPQVAYGGVAFGGKGARSPFTERQVNEFARTYRRPEVLRGGFELYRSLDRDERDNLVARTKVPTLLLTAQGGLASTRPTIDPLITNIERAVEVPRAGHWLPEENPAFVTKELLTFFGRP